jgi:hypothetical protein
MLGDLIQVNQILQRLNLCLISKQRRQKNLICSARAAFGPGCMLFGDF